MAGMNGTGMPLAAQHLTQGLNMPQTELRAAGLEWRVQRYMFWKNKREFLLESDVYPHWCLFAVEDGSFYYAFGEAEGKAGSGSLVLCPPSVPFRRRMLAPSMTFHFILLSLGLEEPVSPEHIGNDFQIPVCFTPGDRQRLFDTFDKWKRIDALKLGNSMTLISHYWNDIWKTWCLEHAGPRISGESGRNTDELMNRAAMRLKERFTESFGVAVLADELGLSPVQLVRRFRAAYRITPGEYLTRLRMERACLLLRDTRLTVDEIATACGYATGNYLSRVFNARIGVSPSEYRKRHRI
jgi:AraC-like DNA-binding protein